MSIARRTGVGLARGGVQAVRHTVQRAQLPQHGVVQRLLNLRRVAWDGQAKASQKVFRRQLIQAVGMRTGMRTGTRLWACARERRLQCVVRERWGALRMVSDARRDAAVTR